MPLSVISWQTVLLAEETRVPGENHQPIASHWQTLLHCRRGDLIWGILLCRGLPSIDKPHLWSWGYPWDITHEIGSQITSVGLILVNMKSIIRLTDWLVFDANFRNISVISWREHILLLSVHTYKILRNKT